MAHHSTEGIKHVTDPLWVMTVLGTIAELLPAVAALFTIVWTAFRIYETSTVQGWLKRK